jgi:septum formation inhibitor MinC
VSLKGTTRGLEILISGSPSLTVLSARLTELLAEAPRFFAGCDARVAFAAPLPTGALACLEDIATRFQLTIIEIGPLATRRSPVNGASSSRVEPRCGARADGTVVVVDDAVPRVTDPGATSSAIPARLAHLSERGPGTPGGLGALDQDMAPAVPRAETASEIALGYSAPYEAVTIEDASDSTPPADGVAGRLSSAVQLADAVMATTCLPAVAAPGTVVDPTETGVPRPPRGPGASPAPAPVAADVSGAGSAAAAVGAPAGAMDTSAATAMTVELAGAVAPGARLVVGPVRSGVIVDHPGHVIVIGDVNPGAEVRAEGSIIVLGRMRGVGHAAIGRAAGFIVALSLQPQQLRIGRMVARAADTDRPSGGTEIAYATGETIVVERFSGRLPSGLAASM